MAQKTESTPEVEAPAPEATTDSVKCDNHPDRDASTYTPGDAVRVNLCPECVPPWFSDPK